MQPTLDSTSQTNELRLQYKNCYCGLSGSDQVKIEIGTKTMTLSAYVFFSVAGRPIAGANMTATEAIAVHRWLYHFYVTDPEELDPAVEADWGTLAVGFLLGCGIPPKRAYELVQVIPC